MQNNGKTRVAIVGYGNIGRHVEAALQDANDFELAGIIRRNEPVTKYGSLDVVIVCTPSRTAEMRVAEALSAGFNAVDSFDIHNEIPAYRRRMAELAGRYGRVAVIAAGWDPGTDSMVRGIMRFCAPKGITYTDFGPGMSMGHTVAVKAVPGVRDALSMTVPLGTGVHRRMVYVELEEGADFAAVSQAIRNDPYFVHDETYVHQVEDVRSIIDMGHGVSITRKAASGNVHNQRFDFRMTVNNPALTAQVLVASARASVRQSPGAYTLIEIPVMDFLEGDPDRLVSELV